MDCQFLAESALMAAVTPSSHFSHLEQPLIAKAAEKSKEMHAAAYFG